MKKNRTIKRDFYLLVIKIVTLSLISTFIMYLCLIIFIFVSTDNENAKTSDYYVKYIDLIGVGPAFPTKPPLRHKVDKKLTFYPR